MYGKLYTVFEQLLIASRYRWWLFLYGQKQLTLIEQIEQILWKKQWVSVETL